MKAGRHDQAFAFWQRVIEQVPETPDAAAAHYNLAVVKEVRGEYQDAFQLISEADRIVPEDELYMEALGRVETRRLEQQALAAQMGKRETHALRVRADPPQSRVRIMNIRERYHEGIQLPRGRYRLLVDHDGYASDERWVEIRDRDLEVEVRLSPR